jgi:hypothetical protein
MAAIYVPVKGLTGLINILTLDTSNTIAQCYTAASTAEGLTASYYQLLALERDPDYNSVDTPTTTIGQLNFVGATGNNPFTNITPNTDMFYFKPLQENQTRQYLQVQRLDIAELKRKGGPSGNTTIPAYRANNTYDILLLPTQYVGNTVVNNPHPSGLIEGRPWT